MIFVRIGSFRITEPDLRAVGMLSFGVNGFDFRGIAPEEKGKRIVDTLTSLKGQQGLECEAETSDKPSHHPYGYGRLETFDSQLDDSMTPVMYRFSGVVTLRS